MARERWTNDGRGRGRRRGDGPIGSPAGERPRPRVARRDRRDDGAVEARPRGASTTTPRPPHTPQTATFTRTAQPAREQDSNSNTNNGRRRHNHNNGPICLVQLKIARDAPRLLGFAIYVWTIPAQVVQIYIAISASAASSGRIERLQRAVPGPSSGVVPAAPFVGPNGRRLRSAWHVVAIMRRRGRAHGRCLKLGCGGPGWSSSSNADATRQPPRRSPLQPALEQRPDPGLTARGLEGGVAHFGSKKCPQRPPGLCEALQNH